MAGENLTHGLIAHGRLALEPGLPLMLRADESAEQFRAYFVGLHEENCLVLRLPPNVGVGWQLGDGSLVTAKFLNLGAVYGFRSEILGKYFKAPLRFLFLSMPLHVEKVEIRKHFRVSCILPATVEAPGASTQGMVTDVGLGGMRFECHTREKAPSDIKEGDRVTLRCLMLGMAGVQEIPCLVRGVRQDSTRSSLGLGFDDLAPEILEAVRGYVNRVVRLTEDVDL